jgi:hypothetical protein
MIRWILIIYRFNQNPIRLVIINLPREAFKELLGYEHLRRINALQLQSVTL